MKKSNLRVRCQSGKSRGIPQCCGVSAGKAAKKRIPSIEAIVADLGRVGFLFPPWLKPKVSSAGKNRKIGPVVQFVAVAALAGCSVLNPYSEKSVCERTDFGQCMSLREAYERSKDGGAEPAAEEDRSVGYLKREYRYAPGGRRMFDHGPKEKLVYRYVPAEVDPGGKGARFRDLYEEGKFRTLSGLIRRTEKPLVAPPKILKVLILPYSSGGTSEVLNMQRFVFLKVEDSRWIFDPKEAD